MWNQIGFTLIELLVVVTIIVVLLALLTPALDKAIYQAELAVCGTHEHAIATSSILYAIGSNRSYPDRPGVRSGATWPTAYIYSGDSKTNAFYNAYDTNQGAGNYVVYDDRPILRQFMALIALADPLTGRLDFESIDSDSAAYSNYNLWFGFKYAGSGGMMKIGDKLRWSETDSSYTTLNPQAKGARNMAWGSDLLVSDRDAVNLNSDTQTCHADYDGVTSDTVLQNGTLARALKMTLSMWTSTGTQRGPVDMNFAYADGSVRRLDHVKFRDEDDRTVLLPESTTNITPEWRQTVPR